MLPAGHRTPRNAFSLFAQILDVVERRLPSGLAAVYSFLQAVAAHMMPSPGSVLPACPARLSPPWPPHSSGPPPRAPCTDADPTRSGHVRRDELVVHAVGPQGSEAVRLHRPADLVALDHVNFGPLFRTVSVRTIATLLVSLLLERRVVLASASLTTLTEGTHAALALLYPFEWQLVLIPIVPKKLLDYCCSPTPFLIGVLADNLPAVERLPLSEVGQRIGRGAPIIQAHVADMPTLPPPPPTPPRAPHRTHRPSS